MIKRKAKRVNNKPIDKQVLRPSEQKGFGNELPPDKALVLIYFDQKGFARQAELFYQFYNEADWKSPKATPFRNWKALATNWIYDHQQEIKLKQRLRTNRAILNDL